jgi:hypothetical protein
MLLEVNKNINDFKEIQNIEKIEVPNFPIEIIDILLKNYHFLKEFVDYKRDATLSLLKLYNAIVLYDDTFNLKIEKKLIDWKEFFDLIISYIKGFTHEAIKIYEVKNKNEFNYNFNFLDENFLGSITDKIFRKIYKSYLNKFSYWVNSPGQQNGYINIDLEEENDIKNKNIRYYWHFKGVIFVQDTKYDEPISFKSELNGSPIFQLVFFDLNQFQYLERNQKYLKQLIDLIEDKIKEQDLKNLSIDLDDL